MIQLAIAIALECIYRREGRWRRGTRYEWAVRHGHFPRAFEKAAAIAPAYEKHRITRRDVGRFERLADCRFWVGPCTCGSGLGGAIIHDERGIYCGISCTACNRRAAPNNQQHNPTEDAAMAFRMGRAT